MKLALFSILFIFLSCTSMKPENCHYDYGYAEGFDDGKRDHYFYPPKDSNGVCSSEALEQAKRGYREGFKAGVKQRQSYSLVTMSSSGFQQKRECLSAFGKKACGYNCVSGFKTVKCAQEPDQKCLAAFGKIKCGHQCVAKSGNIVCK